jgi:hypothetical protein
MRLEREGDEFEVSIRSADRNSFLTARRRLH